MATTTAAIIAVSAPSAGAIIVRLFSSLLSEDNRNLQEGEHSSESQRAGYAQRPVLPLADLPAVDDCSIQGVLGVLSVSWITVLQETYAPGLSAAKKFGTTCKTRSPLLYCARHDNARQQGGEHTQCDSPEVCEQIQE